MEPARASIEVRASIAEALRHWSDPAVRSRQVDFEVIARRGSRVTVEASDPSLDADLVQRQLQRHLAAFKRLLEGGHEQR